MDARSVLYPKIGIVRAMAWLRCLLTLLAITITTPSTAQTLNAPIGQPATSPPHPRVHQLHRAHGGDPRGAQGRGRRLRPHARPRAAVQPLRGAPWEAARRARTTVVRGPRSAPPMRKASSCCRELNLPLHVGEFLFSIADFAEYIKHDALGVVRLIGDNVGGISGSMRVGCWPMPMASNALPTTGATRSTWRCISTWSSHWPTSTGSRCRSPRNTPTVLTSATSSGQTRTAISRRQPIRGWAIQSTARRWTRSPCESTAEAAPVARESAALARERRRSRNVANRILLCVLLLAIFPARALERPEVTFKVFQFPPNMIPRIDGRTTTTGRWFRTATPSAWAELVDPKRRRGR